LRRSVKVLLLLLAPAIVLLVLNAIAVSNETKEASVNVEGAELVQTPNGAVQVLVEGDNRGSPIVLVHCYTCSMRWWDEMAPLLADKHEVIRVDLLGHGGSDKPSTGYSMEDQASAIAQALASLGVSDATVVGHSLGGTVATALAAQSPELASRVVDMDQAPDNSYGELDFTARLAFTPVIGQAMRRMVEIAPDSVVRSQFEQAFAPDFNIASGFEDPDQVVEDLQEMTYTSFVEASDGEDSYTEDTPLDQRLAEAGVPLLVIFGAEDQIYDAEGAVEPYRSVPGARVELIEGVGHSPNVEAPERVAALIEDFAGQADAAERAEKRANQQRKARRQAAKRAARAKRQAQKSKQGK